MEAQQCAREPTGTNWPTLHETTKTQPTKRLLATTIQITLNPHPQHGGSGTTQTSDHICGGHSSGETPGNIPNPEAKPTNANGTAPDRVWESRTPPQHNSNKPPLGPPLQEGVYHCAQTQNTKRKTENSMHAHSKFNILTHESLSPFPNCSSVKARQHAAAGEWTHAQCGTFWRIIAVTRLCFLKVGM